MHILYAAPSLHYASASRWIAAGHDESAVFATHDTPRCHASQQPDAAAYGSQPRQPTPQSHTLCHCMIALLISQPPAADDDTLRHGNRRYGITQPPPLPRQFILLSRQPAPASESFQQPIVVTPLAC